MIGLEARGLDPDSPITVSHVWGHSPQQLSSVSLHFSYSWHYCHRPMKVRNFEFPADIPDRKIFILSRDFPIPYVQPVHVRCSGNLSLTHKVKIMPGFPNEVTRVRLCAQLTALETQGLWGRREMWVCDFQALCTSRLQGWKKRHNTNTHTDTHTRTHTHTHTHTPRQTFEISQRHFTKTPNQQPTEQTALLAALISAATLPLKEQQRLSLVRHAGSVTGHQALCVAGCALGICFLKLYKFIKKKVSLPKMCDSILTVFFVRLFSPFFLNAVYFILEQHSQRNPLGHWKPISDKRIGPTSPVWD